jgi:hypothetical protein
MTMRKFGLYLAASCIVVSALLASMPSAHGKEDDDRSIVGTWIFTITLSQPPELAGFAFTDLIAINRGGTFTNTSTVSHAHSSENPFLPPPAVVDISDGYGVWKRVSDDSNQFALTLKRFLFAGARTPTALYGSFFPGQNVGVANVQAVATIHTGEGGDTLTGQATFQFVNLAGEVVFRGSETFSAARLRIRPLATP